MTTKRLVQNSILTAISLTIFILEAQLPPLTPIPGIKLGLSNIVILFALVFLTKTDAILILTARLFLSALLMGNPIMLLYSASGGFICLFAEIFLLKKFSTDFLWGISSFGALIHNTAQIGVAILITKTSAILSFLPFLWVSGIITGLFTGVAIWYLSTRHKNKIKYFFRL